MKIWKRSKGTYQVIGKWNIICTTETLFVRLKEYTGLKYKDKKSQNSLRQQTATSSTLAATFLSSESPPPPPPWQREPSSSSSLTARTLLLHSSDSPPQPASRFYKGQTQCKKCLLIYKQWKSYDRKRTKEENEDVKELRKDFFAKRWKENETKQLFPK